MNTHIRLTPEIQFCLQYLKDNNICDGSTYDSCIKSLKKSSVSYRLVPVPANDFFTELATKMRELWPTGKKDGKWDWRESVPNITSRLKLLWGKRNLSIYTIEDCLLVCRQYLSSYHDNTKYMKLLKYFIIRQKEMTGIGNDGKVSYSFESEFANMLENLTDEQRQSAKDAEIVESMSADCGGVLI